MDLGEAPVPDETTICTFCHLLEEHNLAPAMLKQVNQYLASRKIKVNNGTIVDATIIHAPSSTNNDSGKRDSEMHQTKKGNAWHFGIKAHAGIDSKTRAVHSLVASAANVHDSRILGSLLHGSETRVWGDSAYRGQREVIREVAPFAADFTNRRGNRSGPLSEREKLRNHVRSRVRSRVEHVFHVLKRIFGFEKVRYRGIYKHEQRLAVNFALCIIYLSRRKLLRA